MENKKARSIDKRPARSLQVLWCATEGRVETGSPDPQWVSSPIRCLDRAVDEGPDIVVVRFTPPPDKENEARLELCAALKRNSHTRERPLLALLPSIHRNLLEFLEQARVDYVRFVGEAPLESRRVSEIVGGLGPADGVKTHLESTCPYLHYHLVDTHREMTVCGAYLDRMVLGGRRLNELCETMGYLLCEYYLNPREKTGPVGHTS